MSRAEYWDQTPHQWSERVAAYSEAKAAEVDSLKYVAWVTASLTRAKRIPSLEVFLNEGRQFSGKEMEAMQEEVKRRAEGWPEHS